MASNKILNNNPWSCMLLIFNAPRLLICIYIMQLQLSRVNCTSQVCLSNKPHEVKHFILVHGLGHGAWCWFRLIPLLEDAGHNTTAIDLSASGTNMKQIKDLRSFDDYAEPLLKLMDSLPRHEKVILVGHSFGGMSLALAMDMYPEKISVAVFVSAFLPDTAHRPSYVIEKFLEQIIIGETFLDTSFYTVKRHNEIPLLAIVLGPNYLKSSLYQLCRPQELELAKSLIRPSSLFLDELSGRDNFSKERFGSVKKVYIKSLQDRAIRINFQHWMIENEGLKEVKEINNTDHMSMISGPRKLCKRLLEVALEH